MAWGHRRICSYSFSQSQPVPVQINAAGSLTNTLLALSRLGQAAAKTQTGAPLQVAAASVSGCDTLGFFYRKQLHSAGVDILTKPEPDSHTGRLRQSFNATAFSHCMLCMLFWCFICTAMAQYEECRLTPQTFACALCACCSCNVHHILKTASLLPCMLRCLLYPKCHRFVACLHDHSKL